MTLAPTRFVEEGYSLADSTTYLLVSGIGYLVGAYATTRFSDRFERKYTAAVFAVAWAISLTDGLGHVGGALAPLIVLGANTAGGFSGAYLVMAVSGLLAGGLILFGIQATGRSLESPVTS